MPADEARPPLRRLGAGRLAGLAALLAIGLLAFLLLLDVLYRQDAPYAAWFTGELSKDAGSALTLGTMAVALVAAVAILALRPREAPTWAPGATCLSCGAWVERPTGNSSCPSCGATLAPPGARA
ncbi:MAG: hypothetical protein ACYC2H_04985 [Thermoplasmatota archaeon]